MKFTTLALLSVVGCLSAVPQGGGGVFTVTIADPDNSSGVVSIEAMDSTTARDMARRMRRLSPGSPKGGSNPFFLNLADDDTLTTTILTGDLAGKTIFGQEELLAVGEVNEDGCDTICLAVNGADGDGIYLNCPTALQEMEAEILACDGGGTDCVDIEEFGASTVFVDPFEENFIIELTCCINPDFETALANKESGSAKR